MALTMISIPLFSSLILQVRKISVKVRGMGCVRSELALGNGSFTRRDTIRRRRRPKLSLRGDRATYVTAILKICFTKSFFCTSSSTLH